MSYFVRQNKTQISRIKNVLEKGIKQRVSNTFSGNYSKSLGRVSIYGSKHEYGMSFSYSLYLILNKANIIVKEIDNRLVFCFSLNDINIGLQSDRRNLKSRILSAYRYKDYTDEVYNEIVSDVGELDSRDFDKLERSNYYKRTVERIEDMCYKCKFVLKEGEYPFMQDRTLFPLIVFDTSNGSGWYIQGDRYNMSYRSNHRQISFNYFDITNDVYDIINGIPVSLISVDSPEGTLSVMS